MGLARKLAIGWLSLMALFVGLVIAYYWPASAPALWVIGFVVGCIGTGVAVGILAN